MVFLFFLMSEPSHAMSGLAIDNDREAGRQVDVDLRSFPESVTPLSPVNLSCQERAGLLDHVLEVDHLSVRFSEVEVLSDLSFNVVERKLSRRHWTKWRGQDGPVSSPDRIPSI